MRARGTPSTPRGATTAASSSRTASSFDTATDEFLLTSAEPNLAYFADLVGRDQVVIEEVTDDYGILAVQGPRSRDLLARLVPGVATIPFFGVTTGTIAGSPVTVSRTGYSGDLGYEIWVQSPDALAVWDALWDSVDGFGVLPSGWRPWTCSGSRRDCCSSTWTSRQAGSAGRTRIARR